ncbi:hypothetical protein [Evansella clarkii]|uniref:hypothetical protein n=1 Tax=Evansella clarkii TaxID=79879 RepID=UPI0014729E86|nr:hypothetical protein [Evansella clarkii]
MNQKEKHMKYRKIALPKKMNFDNHIDAPFSEAFKKGDFRNDIYFTVNPFFIAGVYIKYILIYCWPALLLSGVMFGIHLLSIAVLGDEYTAPTAGIQLLLIVYSICLFFTWRRISDHMAYYNITMLVSKFDINQKYLTKIYRSANIEADKEAAVMDHYRKKFNKLSLFPSMKELALEEQLYQKHSNSKHASNREFAELRRSRLDLDSKREEHLAAKEIADWKQEQYGGKNEYDVMVAKYQWRTVPAIKEIIAEVSAT